MNWIEVIKISIAENRRAALENQIRSMLAELKSEERAEAVRLYRNLLDGDLSIHLCWTKKAVDPHGSKTGNCLSHLLREFGLVSHSVWMEKDA